MKIMDKLYKWIFLVVIIVGGYNFYSVFYEANQALKVSLNRANENLATVLENTNRVITVLSKQINEAQSKTLEIIQKSDENRKFGNRILDKLEAANCEIGKKPIIFRWRLKDKTPCRQWAAQARQEVRLMAFDTYNENEMVEHISKTLLGNDWFIQFPEKEPMPLRQWIQENI